MSPPTVTPNGDGATDAVSIPFSVSEAAVVSAVVTGPDGNVVRSLGLAAVDKGVLGWDGRTARGKAVPDGRYTVAITGRDAAGNVGKPAKVTVDVYAALAGLARSTALFFPQDGDRLARTAT